MHRVDHQRPTRAAVTIAGAVALIAWSLFVAASPVRATPSSLFEIADADIADATGPVGDPPDWGAIFGRTPANTAGAPVSVVNPQGMSTPSFVEDLTKGAALPSPPCSPGKTGDLTVLAGNGSDKNGDALSTWSWGAGNIPPLKDDITNLYGAAGTDTNAHRILYFGLERADNNGSGHLDVEFLKAPMGRTVTGSDASSGCPEGSFSGSRTQGDVLLILDLSKGGALGLSEVRIWNATTSTYDVTTPAAGTVGIAHNETSSIACGDWNCRTPTANTSTLATNTFVEGFIDATALGVSGCFAAFNAKSRASAAWDSELKDIAFGEFNTCDARITISPNGVNEVGTTHTFTGHVDVNATGSFTSAPDGTTISFSIVSGPGSFTGGVNTCTTSGGTGSCSVGLTSSSAGTTVVAASTSVLVGPLTVTRSTNGTAGPGGSGNASKIWADGYVKVTPSAVNRVNQSHAFTVEFGVTKGSGATVGTPTITPSVSPTPNGGVSSGCASPTSVGTDVWQCTVTINSSVAGAFTATASASAVVSGSGTPSSATIARSTSAGSHGTGGNTGATKTYVDADITVGPSGVNAVGDPHTFVATVHVNPGSGRVPAPAGTLATFTVKSGPGAPVSSTCLTIGATGACSVTVSSPIAGVSVVGVAATIDVLGVRFDLTSNGAGANSADAVKRWVNASVAIGPSAINPLDEPHTFTITVTATPSGATPVTFASITPSVAPAPGSVSSTCANPSVSGNVATCTLTINSSEPGTFLANATASVVIGGVTLLRSTDAAVAVAGPLGTGPATKIYERLTVLGEVVRRDLPRTGADIDRTVVASVGLIIGGAALMFGARRRRSSTPAPSRRPGRG